MFQGFATAIGTPDLTAAFDRMSINLPTSSGNPVTLERAAQSFEHGKFGVMQSMHTHKNGYYDRLNEEQTGEPEYTDYYGIVPLWDMNKATGATAVVPGSHKLVPEINAFRKTRTDGQGEYIGPATTEAADIECFFVDHVHVEEEGEIVVRVGVCVIDKDALLEVFHCLGVITNLEV